MADDEQRLIDADSLAQRLDRPVGILGIIFLLVVLAQLLVPDPTGQVVLSIVSWVFWGVFVPEFLLRAYIARFQAHFWRKNWWQVIFCSCHFYAFSARYSRCDSYAWHDLVQCFQREFADLDPPKGCSRIG